MTPISDTVIQPHPARADMTQTEWAKRHNLPSPGITTGRRARGASRSRQLEALEVYGVTLDFISREKGRPVRKPRRRVLDHIAPGASPLIQGNVRSSLISIIRSRRRSISFIQHPLV